MAAIYVQVQNALDRLTASGFRLPAFGQKKGLAISRSPARSRTTSRELRTGLAGYFAVKTKDPRRFRAQHPSFSSVQVGDSSPLLTTTMRSPATPRLTR
jgi:hypothetical protein